MGTKRIPMVEVDRCLICNKYIGKGNDPAVCDDQGCHDLLKYETNFNAWAKEQVRNGKRNKICLGV